jgi:ribosomal protein L17
MAEARTSQLAKDRFFIYLSQKPRSVRLFASRELSPTGVSKRLIEATDPAAPVVRRMMSQLVASAKGGAAKVETIAAVVPEVAQRVGVEAVFLPRTPCYTPRILVTLPEVSP